MNNCFCSFENLLVTERLQIPIVDLAGLANTAFQTDTEQFLCFHGKFHG